MLLKGRFALSVRRIAILMSIPLFSVVVQADVLVIAYMDESAVALVDPKTMQTIARFATGRNPHEVRVTRNGREAFVAAGRHVTAVDLVDRRVRATFDLGSYSAHDIRISRDGTVFWAACGQAKTVLEVDAATGKTIREYKTEQDGPWFVEVSPDERKLYTPNLEGKSVSIIDRSTGQVKVIPLPDRAYGIDITPDGRYLWVSGGDITIIDTQNEKVIASIKASEQQTGRLRMTPDGSKVVVALSKKVAVYDARTRSLVNEVDLPAEPKVLTLSGDGRLAYLTNPEDNSFSIVDIRLGKLVDKRSAGKKPDGIGWAR